MYFNDLKNINFKLKLKACILWCENKTRWLKDISTSEFSTPSFNPGPFNPILFNHEPFNPGLFNHEFLNHGVEKFMVEKSGVEAWG